MSGKKELDIILMSKTVQLSMLVNNYLLVTETILEKAKFA